MPATPPAQTRRGAGRRHVEDDLPPFESAGPDCTSYDGGHQVHWIQALHSGRAAAADAEWSGSVSEVTDGVVVITTDDGRVLRYRNHDLPTFAVARRAARDRVTGNTRFAVVRLDGRLFSVARDSGTPLDACPTLGGEPLGH